MKQYTVPEFIVNEITSKITIPFKQIGHLNNVRTIKKVKVGERRRVEYKDREIDGVLVKNADAIVTNEDVYKDKEYTQKSIILEIESPTDQAKFEHALLDYGVN